MDETKDHWAPQLNAVLQLIKCRPGNIVDDTSIEKLLTHLEDTVKDETGRTALLKSETGVLEFLLVPPESLFSNTVSGNFALRLAGMLGGYSTDTCDLLIGNGSLQSLFGYLTEVKNSAIKNAAMRYSFYEGLQMLLGNAHGYKWIMTQGYFTNAIHAFNDASFYVTKSAITLLAKLLISSTKFETLQHISGKPVILQTLLSEYPKCDETRMSCNANLISLIFDHEPDQGFEILQQFGGIHAMLTSKPAQKNSALLQAVSDICCKIISTGRSMDCFGSIFYEMKNESSQKMELTDFLLNICVDIANTDIMHFIPHITKIVCNAIPFPGNVPPYWNELLIHLTIWSALHSQTQDVTKTSNLLRRKFEVSKEYPFLEDALNLLGKLEKIIKCKTIDTAVWRKFFSTVLDNSKALFKKELQSNASLDTKQIIERFSLFLCDVMLIGVDVTRETAANVKAISISTSQARRSFIGKCIGTQIILVLNDWFNEFTMNAKLKLCESVVTLLTDSSLNAQTLTSCIQLFSSLISVMTAELASVIFHINAPSMNNPTVPVDNESCCLSMKLAAAFESLIVDSRWEVQDSLLDMVVKMIDKTKDYDALKVFLVHCTFWMKAWQLLDADESYIRASSVRVIGIVLEKNELREIFVQDFPLETVIAKLLDILKHDDEAFPKRSVMDAVLRWLDVSKVTEILFRKNDSKNLSANGEKFEKKLCQMILKSLIIAAEDFDWEVKLKGSQCWHRMTKTMLNSIGRNQEELYTGEGNIATNDSSSFQLEEDEKNDFVNEKAESNTGKVNTSTNFDETVSSKNLKRNDFSMEGSIEFLCKTGGSKILFDAVNDCDQLVREEALKTLRYIRKEIIDQPNSIQMLVAKITSCYDLENLVAKINFSEEKDFVDMLIRIDFDSLAESMKLADDHVANHSISLLKDIIAAAQHSDDNLLDCY